MTKKTEPAAVLATTTQTARPPAKSIYTPTIHIDTTPADWSTWAHIPEPYLWQAVALSLNLEPTVHDVGFNTTPERAGTLPAEFHKRLFIASQNKARLGMLKGASDPAYILRVQISTFFTWAKSIGWALPDQFPKGDEGPPPHGNFDADYAAEPANGGVRLSEEAARRGVTSEALLFEAAAGKMLLYVALSPLRARLVAARGHSAPRSGTIQVGGHQTVPLLPSYANSMALAGKVDIAKWQATLNGGGLDWHYWMLDTPQTVTAENIFAARHIADAREQAAAPVDAEVDELERTKLLKIVGLLGVLLSEKHHKYRRGDKVNSRQISQSLGEILATIEDANKYGLGDTNMRTAIAEGVDLLRK